MELADVRRIVIAIDTWRVCKCTRPVYWFVWPKGPTAEAIKIGPEWYCQACLPESYRAILLLKELP